MSALAIATEGNTDVPTAIVFIILCLVAIGFWIGSEFQLRHPANQEPIGDPDRDAIAETVGLIDQRRSVAYAGEFADGVAEAARRRGGAS